MVEPDGCRIVLQDFARLVRQCGPLIWGGIPAITENGVYWDDPRGFGSEGSKRLTVGSK
ncbi:MAG: hypothetical protein K0R39_3310 [Symbiobacteriaceae bacterium]|jgi:hypothetical protein|nr:hypothetical protein [Symbiobacteriaceae bacterium]